MNLKAIIILITLFSLSLNAQIKFSISGSISHQYEGADIVLYSKNSAFAPIKTKENNGKFYFTGEIEYDYELAFLSVQKEGVEIGGISFFIGEMHMEIDIKEFNKIHFLNVPFLREKRIFEEMTTKYLDSIKFASENYFNRDRDIYKNSKKDSLWSIVSNFRKKLLKQKVKFIELFPNDYISLYYFNTEVIKSNHPITINELDTIYNKFSNEIKETDLGKTIGEYIKKKLSLTIGHILPNFSFISNKGENYDMSTIYNNKKLVLLCFWGSGCAPCIKKIPTLKKLNEKYESKGLQLISISLDTEVDWWFSSLKKHEIPWLQTCDVNGYNHGKSIRKILDVNHMPQYFLIDNTGELVYHNEQSNEDDDFTVLLNILNSQMK